MSGTEIGNFEVEGLDRAIEVEIERVVDLQEWVSRRNGVFESNLTEPHAVSPRSATLSVSPVVGECQFHIAGGDVLTERI